MESGMIGIIKASKRSRAEEGGVRQRGAEIRAMTSQIAERRSSIRRDGRTPATVGIAGRSNRESVLPKRQKLVNALNRESDSIGI